MLDIRRFGYGIVQEIEERVVCSPLCGYPTFRHASSHQQGCIQYASETFKQCFNKQHKIIQVLQIYRQQTAQDYSGISYHKIIQVLRCCSAVERR
jgi:hypothetical protein